ncbi:MAG: alpha-hydroxy-acid oxidizing protein, partial [Anaerolineae bacterium]
MPGMGGLGSGASFMNNVAALARYRLNLRTLHDKDAPDTRLTLFGHALEIPILVAPVAGTALNMNNAVPEEDLADAMMGGAVAAGSLGMAGDGPNPMLAEIGFATLARYKGRGCFISKPRRTEDILRLLHRAEEAGAWAVGVDIDAAGIVGMVRAGQYVGPKPASAWREIASRLERPFILK